MLIHLLSQSVRGISRGSGEGQGVLYRLVYSAVLWSATASGGHVEPLRVRQLWSLVQANCTQVAELPRRAHLLPDLVTMASRSGPPTADLVPLLGLLGTLRSYCTPEESKV